MQINEVLLTGKQRGEHADPHPQALSMTETHMDKLKVSIVAFKLCNFFPAWNTKLSEISALPFADVPLRSSSPSYRAMVPESWCSWGECWCESLQLLHSHCRFLFPCAQSIELPAGSLYAFRHKRATKRYKLWDLFIFSVIVAWTCQTNRVLFLFIESFAPSLYLHCVYLGLLTSLFLFSFFLFLFLNSCFGSFQSFSHCYAQSFTAPCPQA